MMPICLHLQKILPFHVQVSKHRTKSLDCL